MIEAENTDGAHGAMGDFAVAAIQPPEPLGARETLLMQERAWAIAGEEAASGAQLVVLPEYFNVMGLPPEDTAQEAARTDRFHAAARSFCQRHSCWLVLPLIEERADGRFNAAHLYSPEGQCVFTYDKTHVTEAERTVYGLAAGNTLDVYEAPFGTIGIMICYDVYFPEVARTLALKGADILVLPSLQRSDTPERCMLLCRARAIDSQAFLVRSSYARPAGEDVRAGHCYGRSCVVAPDGTVFADAGATDSAASSRISPRWQWTRPTSGGMPAKPVREFLNADRRPDLYGCSTRML